MINAFFQDGVEINPPGGIRGSVNLNSQKFDCLYFWYPLRYNFIQYLIWKVSLIVKTYPVGKSVAVFLHYQKLIWILPILLHTGQRECSVLTTAVLRKSKPLGGWSDSI